MRLLVVDEVDEIVGVTRICASVHVLIPVAAELGVGVLGDALGVDGGEISDASTDGLAGTDGPPALPTGALNPEGTPDVGLGL